MTLLLILWATLRGRATPGCGDHECDECYPDSL